MSPSGEATGRDGPPRSEPGNRAGEGEEPDEQLLGTELARCYLAYLLGEGLADRLEKEGEVDFFDTWG